jgi:glucose-1-phosphate adenylyltransferase
MRNPRILAIVLAGGEGRRLQPLTLDRAKPAVELRRGFYIVDFVLANLANSRVPWIYLLVHYKPRVLLAHVARVWQPVMLQCGCLLQALSPHEGDEGYRGTADALYRHLDLIVRHDPFLVAVFAADHVYRMGLRPMAGFHRQRLAEITVAAVPVPIEEAHRFGVIQADSDGRILEFREKPANPECMPGDRGRAFVSMGNYLFDPAALSELLEANAGSGGTDLGADVLPLAVRAGMRDFAYDFSRHPVPGVKPYEDPAYWRDIGTVTALTEAREDVKGRNPRFDLRNQRWPVQPAAIARRSLRHHPS